MHTRPTTESSADHATLTGMVTRARRAQELYAQFTQVQVDALVRAIGKYVFDHAEALARLAVEETGLGNVEDKVFKKQGKAATIWLHLKGKKSRGIIGEDEALGLTYIAKPLGVVGAVTPVTNPIVTPMCNAMLALKCGNAVILAPHPKAQQCADHLATAFSALVAEAGGPEHLIQVVPAGTVETTQELMRQVDVVIATGGGAMVKSAYRSGRPAYGVGPGNVPVIFDRDIDLPEAAAKVVLGAAFDHSLICSHEQCVLVPQEQFDAAVAAFEHTGKVWYSAEEPIINAFRRTIFVDGVMNRAVVGVSASQLAAAAGVSVPPSTRLIMLRAAGAGPADALCREKLCPVLAILPYQTFDDALAMAQANLEVEGKGHTAAIFSRDQSRIRAAGLHLTVSRLVVNQPSSISAGGSFVNGFAPTTTLGCGSWGGNSISENLDYTHLMNVSRIGRVIPHKKVPENLASIW